ncbi:large ribosomal subunit protein mL43-like [Halichondria panicea]|uniref:large ribosomal subunit protein mL43-like n=1 Tax=Halichondria panicea TaxID=6063 RepID=UPI00312BB517
MAKVVAPMSNGVGSFVCQLKRLTFQYCKAGGSSKGVRQYLDSYVVKLAKEAPHTAIYVRLRPGRHPRLVGEFLNGNSQVVPVPNLSSGEIKEHVWRLGSASGEKVKKLKKYWHTDNPSIQGNWSPFLYK